MRRHVRRLDNQVVAPGSFKFKLQRLGIEYRIIIAGCVIGSAGGLLIGLLYLKNIVAGLMLSGLVPMFICDVVERKYKKYLSPY